MALLSRASFPCSCWPAPRSGRDRPKSAPGGPGFVVRLLGCLLAAGAACPSRAQSPPPSEYQIKAAFLYNFARFVDWPVAAFADSTSPFVFGILGTDPYGVELDALVQGKTIGGRPLRVERFRTPAQAERCQILFVGASEQENLRSILAALAASPVLTVADTPAFARDGGHIQFVSQENKVRFEINLRAAERAGLRIGSKLLRLATVVYAAER